MHVISPDSIVPIERVDVIKEFVDPDNGERLAIWGETESEIGKLAIYRAFSPEIDRTPSGFGYPQINADFANFRRNAKNAQALSEDKKYGDLYLSRGFTAKQIGEQIVQATIPTAEAYNASLDRFRFYTSATSLRFYEPTAVHGLEQGKQLIDHFQRGLIPYANPAQIVMGGDSTTHAEGYASFDDETVKRIISEADEIQEAGIELNARGLLVDGSTASQLAATLEDLSGMLTPGHNRKYVSRFVVIERLGELGTEKQRTDYKRVVNATKRYATIRATQLSRALAAKVV